MSNSRKILLICNPTGNIGYHRLANPWNYISKHHPEVKVQISTTYLDVEADFVMFNRMILNSEEAEDAIIDRIKKKGQKLVCDIDDYWILPEGHHLEGMWKSRQLTRRLVKNIERADMVTVTSEILAYRVRKHNQNVIVIPNGINVEEDQWKPNPQPSDRCRIGYVASASHTNDVPLMADAIAKLHEMTDIKEYYTLKLIGHVATNGASNQFKEVFMKNAGPGCIEIIPWSSVFIYGKNYNHLDCALAPLADNVFNNCKSNIKVLEAAAHKLPIICSKIPPYYGSVDKYYFGLDWTCLYPEDHDNGWLDCFRWVILDPISRKKYGEQAYEIFMQNYTYDKVNVERMNLIE